MAYADYTYYTDAYHGSAIGAEPFPRLAETASAYLDAATMGRAKSALGDQAEAVKKAMCALAEIFQDEERMNARAYSADRLVSSETVGGWSRSYGSQPLNGTETGLLESRKRNTLWMYLANTGLLRARGYAACRD